MSWNHQLATDVPEFLGLSQKESEEELLTIHLGNDCQHRASKARGHVPTVS